jgi:hypothetical protein
MTQVCCPSCQLRVSRAAAAYLVVCPECGEPLERDVTAEQILGFRLVAPDVLPEALPTAVAIAMPDSELPASPR